ncbi:MAG: hypothetical protein ACQEQL_07375 [Pseudomonadota bacterium]
MKNVLSGSKFMRGNKFMGDVKFMLGKTIAYTCQLVASVSGFAALLTTPALGGTTTKGLFAAAMIGGGAALFAAAGAFTGFGVTMGLLGSAGLLGSKTSAGKEMFRRASLFAGTVTGGVVAGFSGYQPAHDIVVNGMDNDPMPEVRTEAPSAKVPESMRENFSKATDRKTGATFYIPPKLTMNTAQFKMQS